MNEVLSLSLQENLLYLLAFDDGSCQVIRNSVEVNRWGNPIYREIAARVYDYIDRYKEAPKDHTPDLLEDRVRSNPDEAERELYVETLLGLKRLNEEQQVQPQYILDQLHEFVRHASLTQSVIEMGEALQQGDLEHVEELLHKASDVRTISFEPGVRLLDTVHAAFNREIRSGVVPMGIPELDRWELGPGRGEFLVYIAPPKSGKSWFLIHVCKRALLHKMRCLYVTLELSAKQIGGRLQQSLLSISRHNVAIPLTRIHTDSIGRLVRFEPDMLGGSLSFDEPGDEAIVERKLRSMYGINANLVIKQFPAGELTVRGFTAYLDMLERSENFIPDMVMLDYPKYMKYDPRNYRIEVGQTYDQLRGVAMKRNMGIVVASESNRQGAGASLVQGAHAGEDYSRIYTADTVLTYTQTMQERQLGLARLFVDSTRVADRDKFVVLMSQCYPVGQYCLDSVLMQDGYPGMLEEASSRVQSKQEATT